MAAVTGRRARANALLLLASAIWGFAFVAQRIGASVVGPFTFNAVRFALGALVVVVIAWWLAWMRRHPLDLTVGRELKMIELEKEVDALLRELGRPPKHQ